MFQKMMSEVDQRRCEVTHGVQEKILHEEEMGKVETSAGASGCPTGDVLWPFEVLSEKLQKEEQKATGSNIQPPGFSELCFLMWSVVTQQLTGVFLLWPMGQWPSSAKIPCKTECVIIFNSKSHQIDQFQIQKAINSECDQFQSKTRKTIFFLPIWPGYWFVVQAAREPGTVAALRRVQELRRQAEAQTPGEDFETGDVFCHVFWAKPWNVRKTKYFSVGFQFWRKVA